MPLSGIAVVTGGAGFIGSHIASALAASGARVRIIDDLSTGHQENMDEIKGDIDFVRGSVADEGALKKAMDGAELVFHEAAIPSVPRSVENPRQTHTASVDGTFSLLLAARDNKVRRLIYAASSSAYGDQPTLPKSEEMLPDPLSPYAVAKLVGEYYCQVFTRVYGLETISLRYFNVFGPRQDPASPYAAVIPRFLSALLERQRPVVFGDGEQSRDFTYISNVVDANLKAADSNSAVGQVINIANGQRVTINQVFEMVKKFTGHPHLQAQYAPSRTGDVRDSLADLSLARSLLAYEPRVQLEEGLRSTIDWWTSSRFSKAA